ncbi:MAG: DUF4258 domain-containing protein [Blastocatellia bacterium]|nr:DUF4258 domain-containing protein [Blastocatellia bacterium]
MSTRFVISEHARTRMNQRRLSEADLDIVWEFGRVHHAAGAEFYFLAAADLPAALSAQYAHLVGTTLVIEDGVLVTTYKNHHALEVIKRKQKFQDKRPRRSR